MLEKLTIGDFQPHLNQQFFITFASEATHAVQLIKITPWSHGSDKYRQPFTLEFETDFKEKYYPQGVFVLQHPEHGPFDLFMVPIGPSKKGMIYEVVIS